MPIHYELTQRLTSHTPGTFWITLVHAQVTDLTYELQSVAIYNDTLNQTLILEITTHYLSHPICH